MKKFLVVAVLACFFSATSVFAEETTGDSIAWAPVVLVASDALLLTATIISAVQMSTLSKDYETLRKQIDNTTDANYYRLLYEQEKVNSSSDTTTIACTAAGIAVAYTIADYFWLHNAFKPVVGITGDGVKLGMTVKY